MNKMMEVPKKIKTIMMIAIITIIIIRYGNIVITGNIQWLQGFVKYWLLSGHTSSKGCKYDLMVKFNLLTKSFADSSATVTDSFIQKSL